MKLPFINQKMQIMKTLENQTLLYDEDCPLCQAYTTGFIKTGMLDKNGKKPFSNLTEDERNFIDFKRASNEIALVDNKNKTVIYGIDSLLKVIGNSFPWIEKVGNVPPVKYLLKKLYSFISYNRKVIIPNQNTNTTALQCVPSFNYKYRIIYILFTIVITALTLHNFSNLITNLPRGNFGKELAISLGQIVFQALFLLKIEKRNLVNYIGNLMTVSLTGALLLTPILILNQFINIPQIIILIWFAFVVLFMFMEHSRRIKILKLPTILSYTWVIYRAIVLLFILTF
jgi:predicted DCC family thiol-disulfide oxidoreductase YuxK